MIADYFVGSFQAANGLTFLNLYICMSVLDKLYDSSSGISPDLPQKYNGDDYNGSRIVSRAHELRDSVCS